MTAVVWIAVAGLSGVGAVARAALQAAVQRRTRGAFPSGTLAVNVLGSLALGVLHGAGLGGDGLLLAGTALLGSFTTFSTWMLESEFLRADGAGRLAGVNAAVSLAAGLAATALGWIVAAAL